MVGKRRCGHTDYPPQAFRQDFEHKHAGIFLLHKVCRHGSLFDGLAIWQEESYRQLQGTYPVISLSFANVKEASFSKARKQMYEQIVYNHLNRKKNAIWSLLLASGYLKVEEAEFVQETGQWLYTLTLTNREVRIMFEGMVRDWFVEAEDNYNDFIKALLLNDLKAMNTYMNKVALQTFSYFDAGRRPSGEEPERFYHGFVLGLMVELADRYVLTSNRESGFGRYDIMLEPRKGAGGRGTKGMNANGVNAIIIEFKVQDSDEKELSDTVASALEQIDRMQYEAALIQRGIPKEHIRKYGFAFRGKEVLIG